MLRENSGTQPVIFTRSDGTLVEMGGERSKASTRRKFPQVTANLAQRYCSGSLKIDVARLLVNDEAFLDGKTLVITGERAEESPNRARYAEVRTASQRPSPRPQAAMDRPLAPRSHSWNSKQVWDIAERYSVTPFPPIFWAGDGGVVLCVSSAQRTTGQRSASPCPRSSKELQPTSESSGTRSTAITAWSNSQTWGPPLDPFWLKVATSKVFTLPIFMDNWTLPIGAYGDSCGPT